jgi:hypothetical protein
MHTIEHNEVKGVHQGRCAVSQGRSGNDGHGTSSRQPGLQFQAWPVLTGLYCTVRSVNPPHSTSTSASLISLIFSNLSNLSNLFDVLALNHPIHNLHPSSLPPSPPSINPSIRRHISTSCSGSLPNLLNRPAELSPSSPPSADPSDWPAGATVARNLPQPHRPEPETARSGSCQHGSAVWLRSTAGCRRSAVIAGAVLGPPVTRRVLFCAAGFVRSNHQQTHTSTNPHTVPPRPTIQMGAVTAQDGGTGPDPAWSPHLRDGHPIQQRRRREYVQAYFSSPRRV